MPDNDQDPTVNFTGAWKNQRKSTMNLQLKDGRVTGTYRTAVGTGDEPPKEWPLVGFAMGDQIAFVVRFDDFESMTAWAGQVLTDEQGNAMLQTLWHNTQNVDNAHEPSDGWRSFLAGADNFTRVEGAKK